MIIVKKRYVEIEIPGESKDNEKDLQSLDISSATASTIANKIKNKDIER